MILGLPLFIDFLLNFLLINDIMEYLLKELLEELLSFYLFIKDHKSLSNNKKICSLVYYLIFPSFSCLTTFYEIIIRC